MKRGIFIFLLITSVTTFSFGFSLSARGAMEYFVSAPEPHTHYFEVAIHLKNYHGEFVDFKLPVWTPGSYLVREYAKNVEGFAAYSSHNKPLNFHKVNKNTWRVEKEHEKEVIINYRVYSFEGNVRMSYLDENHAFIMANTLLMYVDDLMDSSSILHLTFNDSWTSVSTSLSKIGNSGNSFYVPNYDILVDSPIEIGTHDIIEFEAAGVPHEVAMVGGMGYDKTQLVHDLTKIIVSATSIFNENPNEKYTFIIHANKRSGGLEHISSTVLGVDRWSFANQRLYENFLGLAAHEYFHLWLVKRLKPVELEKLDYDKEIYTDLLWVMEGFTSYFEEKIMLDCGFYSEQRFINNILAEMAKVQNTPGSREQSVAEASFDAWIKFYRGNENSENSQISYYNKGLVLGALLDLVIISGSKGEQSLDDVMADLYHEFYKQKGKGINSDDLKNASGQASKKELSGFFDDYVFGTKDIEYEKFLLLAGLQLVETNSNLNGKSLGAKLSDEGGRLIIKSVERDGSAFDSGLSVGDELISINDYRVDRSNVQRIINLLKVGDQVKVLLSRNGMIMEKELDIRKDDSVRYSYEILDQRTKLQVKVYKTWLGK